MACIVSLVKQVQRIARPDHCYSYLTSEERNVAVSIGRGEYHRPTMVDGARINPKRKERIMNELNASQTVALALESLVTDELWQASPFPMVRFTFPHDGRNVAQTLNRELDRNSTRIAIVKAGEGICRRTLGESELATVLGHVAFKPSIAKSVVVDEWIMTAGLAGIFSTHPDGLASTSIARYSKQGFGLPRIYWHAADGIATATLDDAL
jgi:hypothetical protein